MERIEVAAVQPTASVHSRRRQTSRAGSVLMPGMATFTGVIPALLTPFDDGLALLTDPLTENIRSLQDAGIGHVVVCGTMGEAGALSREERATVIETALASGVRVT